MASLALSFNGVELTPFDRNDDQVWITSKQLAEMLEYADDRAVSRIFNKHSDEFTSSMTEVVKATTPPKTLGLVGQMRVFSLRGCHLIAMFSRTKKAKEFRVWVLNIIDKEVASQSQVITMADLQRLDDEIEAEYAVDFIVASSNGKGLSDWKKKKAHLEAKKAVVKSLMQPQLPNIEVVK